MTLTPFVRPAVHIRRLALVNPHAVVLSIAYSPPSHTPRTVQPGSRSTQVFDANVC